MLTNQFLYFGNPGNELKDEQLGGRALKVCT